MVVVQARKVLDSRSATEESADLVTIARYLVEAVANEEITVVEAKLAIVDWTHDRGCCVRRSARAVQTKARHGSCSASRVVVTGPLDVAPSESTRGRANAGRADERY